jgi:hypothetical protein
MYTLTRGLDSEEISDLDARMLYDLHPEKDRSGARDGAFILWWNNAAGFRSIPVLLRPKAAR